MFGKKIGTVSSGGVPGTPCASSAGAAPLWTALLAALLVTGCGGKEGASAPGSADETTAGASRGDEDDRGPCALLSSEQVNTVLPGHDGGSVAANGGSLIKGVDSYQCSYTRIEGTDALLFTVIVHRAHDDAAFGEIKPSNSFHEDHQPAQAGDAAWLYGDDKDLKLQMLKGRSVVELELMTPDAAAKKDAVVELARALAGKVS